MPSTPQQLKVGIIDYVHALPLFHNIQSLSPYCVYTYGTPQTINRLLEEGALDTALISSSSYLDNRSEYLLLSPFAIAAQEEILSVRLYYPGELESTSFIHVPTYSATATALLKILCNEVWKISPHYLEIPVVKGNAFLSIGDECLTLSPPKKYSFIDLGQAWREWTDKPFVFALIATRVDRVKSHHQLLKEFFRALEQQLTKFEADPDEIINAGAQKLKCSPQLIRNYYRLIDYRIHEEHFSGLERYALLR